MNAVAIVARLTWLRLRRGRSKWVSALLALVPPAIGFLFGFDDSTEPPERWRVGL